MMGLLFLPSNARHRIKFQGHCDKRYLEEAEAHLFRQIFTFINGHLPSPFLEWTSSWELLFRLRHLNLPRWDARKHYMNDLYSSLKFSKILFRAVAVFSSKLI